MSAIQMMAWIEEADERARLLAGDRHVRRASCATRSWVWKFVGSVGLEARRP